MSKESSIPLKRTIRVGERLEERVIDERYRRYPVTDRLVAEALGCNKDSGHHEPRPRRRRRS